MVITLKQELIMSNFKTIDGHDANVHIAYGDCITIQFIANVIIHDLYIHHCKQNNNAIVCSSPSYYGCKTLVDDDGISVEF
ncbi:pectate lyase 15 [Spatholobus suberectus]|nr:pectate lyase 15 [Spatholobus suberectus]